LTELVTPMLMQPLSSRIKESRAAPLRILHVDDEADIRLVVELSLGLDPAFRLRSAASGAEALAAAVTWEPDLVLCDVMMPGMDGPAMLASLRRNPQTAHIPVVFMTGFIPQREAEDLKALGALGVVAKPFDAMTLPKMIRGHLRAAGLAALRLGFCRRLRGDAAVLERCRVDLADPACMPATLARIGTFAHALAGAAGIFGFWQITVAAAALEIATREEVEPGAASRVETALDRLLADIEQSDARQNKPCAP
jgi:CheY-like chemotaxis protein